LNYFKFNQVWAARHFILLYHLLSINIDELIIIIIIAIDYKEVRPGEPQTASPVIVASLGDIKLDRDIIGKHCNTPTL
jgi:hypothetical protein